MTDIYQEITDRIIEKMEQGIIPWHKDWNGLNAAVKYRDSTPYSLLNQILLGDAGEYISFNEAKKLGGKVKKGAKGKMVVFWTFLDKKDEDGNVEKDKDGNVKKIPYLKKSIVFHISDCEGIESKLPEQELNDNIKPIDAAQSAISAYIERTGIKYTNKQQGRAYYSPSDDEIVLPLLEQFDTAEGYYATALHECIHSTGHKDRLNRLTDVAAFGSETYSNEELVAEIGSAFLCNMLGIETDGTITNSAAYIQSWLKALRNDKKLIVTASGKAEKATKYFLGE